MRSPRYKRFSQPDAETLTACESSKLDTIAPFHTADAADVGIIVMKNATDPNLVTTWRSAGIDVTTV